ncbi:MAG: oligosaccharide flippase family protein [Agathobacter sp.]|nr:oligosaccharide flippase family protein [Agathobacter sp.]
MNGRIFMTVISQSKYKSRGYYVKKNIIYSITYQIVNLVLKFLLRTIFIYTLGKSYLGISGVFSNILTVLSLSELGIGAAIIYDMYEPIANNDYKQINKLMGFYKYIYTWIGIFILVVGCLLTPFLKFIISDVPDVKFLRLIYILHVINTSSSYFFAHYRSFITANQKNYILTINNIFFNVLKVIVEVVVLIFFHNYIIYMLVEMFVQYFSNFHILYKCKKIFPYINTKSEKIENKFVKKVLFNALSSFNIKLGGTIVNATDNIVISAIIGTSIVGLYYNYSMIISIITATTMLISSSAQASVGNLCTEKNNKRKLEVFNQLQFVYCLIYGICLIGIIFVLNSFMNLWLGNEYVLPFHTVCLIGICCWLTGIRQPLEIYIYADGLFEYYKYKPWIEALINLIVSIGLAIIIGLDGIFIGTIISNILTSFWYEPYVVFKRSFNTYVRLYYVNLVKYACVTIFSIILCGAIFNYINISYGIVDFIMKSFICISVFTMLVLIFLRRNEAFYFFRFKNHK